MTPELKEHLLLRYFSSIEYMEKFTLHFVSGLQAAEDAFSIFEKKYQTDKRLINQYSMEFRQWKERVIPNFQGMKANAIESLKNAKNGRFSTIRSATGNLHGLSKDMDGIGYEWWKEVDPQFWDIHMKNMNMAEQMGANIYYTLSDFWNAGEILNERITGPIDEQQLLVFLLPDE